jgi:hypothetical protein
LRSEQAGEKTVEPASLVNAGLVLSFFQPAGQLLSFEPQDECYDRPFLLIDMALFTNEGGEEDGLLARGRVKWLHHGLPVNYYKTRGRHPVRRA